MSTDDLLRDHGLRLTKPRLKVLEYFAKNTGKAIATVDLVQLFHNQIDKVTLYRTLHTFEESQLVHRIFDNSGIEKFALCVGICKDHETEQIHNHAHTHCQCIVCNETSCFMEIEIPQIMTPKGYEVQAANFVISGKCNRCS